MVGLDLVDVDDLPLVEDAQVHGLLRGLHQGPQEGRGDLSDGAAPGDLRTDLEGFEAETVALGVRVLPDIAA
jgi:hypothetical protein